MKSTAVSRALAHGRLAQIALEEFAQSFEGDRDRGGSTGRHGKGFVKAGYSGEAAGAA